MFQVIPKTYTFAYLKSVEKSFNQKLLGDKVSFYYICKKIFHTVHIGAIH